MTATREAQLRKNIADALDHPPKSLMAPGPFVRGVMDSPTWWRHKVRQWRRELRDAGLAA